VKKPATPGAPSRSSPGEPSRRGTETPASERSVPGRQDWRNRCNCCCWRDRLHRFDCCNHTRGTVPAAPAAMQWVGRIGAIDATAAVGAIVCTASTAAIIPKGLSPQLRRPCSGSVELLRSMQLLPLVRSFAPLRLLQSYPRDCPRSTGGRAVGRQNWCDRCNCCRWRDRLHLFNRRNRTQGTVPAAPAAVQWVGRIVAIDATAAVGVIVCTASTAAIIPKGLSLQLRRPCSGSAELLQSVHLLLLVRSFAPLRLLQSYPRDCPRSSGGRAVGRQNWCNRCNCCRWRDRLRRFDCCNHTQGTVPATPAAVQWVGRIGAIGATAAVGAIVCTASTAAIIPKGLSLQLRRPCSGPAELVQSVHLLPLVRSFAPLRLLQSYPRDCPCSSGGRAVGRQDWCDPCNCWCGCFRLHRTCAAVVVILS
jgi:hypothetical protein